ncbi:exonuclease SbcCD subunit D [Halopenitus sp. H-Gu1]|uniref:metallophosphoesterase family protein n=1 Tax=Halopenitus sp. H-Gu1 TaxID=3242697 RepID=UPI00359D5B6B
MRLAHAADIHLGHRQYGLSQREVDARLSFQKFLSQARKHDADAILIPGDLFDSRDIRPETLQQTENILEDVQMSVIVSPGNHDENMSRRRSLTWLQYLNNRGLVTLLSGDLTTDRASFAPTDTDDPRKGGGGYVDLKRDGELVRCFGLQYRGAYIERDLPAVTDGIQAVNDTEVEPDVTILLAHFGVDDAVPDLGANISRSALTDLEDLVDYIALGHIHKQYESGTVAHNPGSLEAFNIKEGRWSDEHGYYIYDTQTETADHHLSKRRPYVTLNFDVSGFRTFEDLRAEFEDEVANARTDVEDTCRRSIYRDGTGGRRRPLINLRLEGTLLLDHATFDVETLTDIIEEELDALYTQPTNHTERKAVQELLGDLERNEAFNPDGTVNTDALQDRVFTTLAGESRYSGETDAVADTLDRTEKLVNKNNQSTVEVAEFLRERRRELFPDGQGAEDDEEVAE